jgi:hypothetical protein
VTDVSTPLAHAANASRKLAPFLTRRTILLLAASLLVTLLFVREHRRQQGPCRSQFHSQQVSKPRFLLVQDDDENPGDAGLPADPCDAKRVFNISPERAYAALALSLWAVTGFCSAQDISAFRKSLRRRRMRRAGNASRIEGGQTS